MTGVVVPKGKVSCLLCRGFVGYKNSDRSRFRAHMEEEHDVRYDSDVVLAVSVLTRQEREVLVRLVGARLGQIGRGELPHTSTLEQELQEALAPPAVAAPPAGSAAPAPAGSTAALTQLFTQKEPVKFKAQEPMDEDDDDEDEDEDEEEVVSKGGARGGAAKVLGEMNSQVSSLARGGAAGRARGFPLVQGRGRGRGSARGAWRGGQGRGRGAAPPAPSPVVVQPPRALHGNLAISVSVVDQTSACTQCGNTFPNKDAMAEHVRAAHLNRYSGLTIGTPKEVKDSPRPVSPLREFTSRVREAVRESTSPAVRTLSTREALGYRGARQGAPGRASPKLIYRGAGGGITPAPAPALWTPAPSPPSPTASPPSPRPEPMIKCSSCGQLVKQSVFPVHKAAHSKQEEPQAGRLLDYVDLEDSDSEKVRPSTPTIPCNKCGKLLATNMALRMHINLRHSVKEENKDAEELLTEEYEVEERIKNEVEGMETLELLDNLVNFLNDP